MSEQDRQVIQAVIRALDGPRDRLYRLMTSYVDQEPLHHFWRAFQAAGAEPCQHGVGRDTIDQASMVLKCLLLDNATKAS